MRKYTRYLLIRDNLKAVAKRTAGIVAEGGGITRIAPASWKYADLKCEGYRVDYVSAGQRYYRSMRGTQSRCATA
jgi:hypothetical protein